MQQMGIKDIRVQWITPATAMKMLEKNHSNRPVRKSVIETYARDMSNGNWQTTHQGIALNTNGELIDGQHRLYAIMKSGIPLNMVVTTYTGDTKVFGIPVDMHVKRSISDLMDEDKHITEVLIFLSRDLWGNTSKGCGLAEMIQFREKLDPYIQWWKNSTVCNTKKTFARAPVKAAVLVAYIVGGVDWTEQYNALVNTHVETFNQSTASLYRKLQDPAFIGRSSSGNTRKNIFCVSYLVASCPDKIIKSFTAPAMEKAWEQAREGMDKFKV